MDKQFTILAIETSCDETAAAIYVTEKGVLSNVLFSQINLHAKFGGVIPEVASRFHLEKINFIVQEALIRAQKKLSDIQVIAVTNKPGLPGSLLVGLNFAKGLAWSTDKKIIGVNHLEGHIFSACIDNTISFPFLCLTASGGHTSLYKVHDFGKCDVLATTKDDAAGEAFDKIAKLVHLPYPGGPIIEKLAQQINFEDFFNYPRLKNPQGSFSFSGLKTAVLYDLVKRGAYDLENKKFLEPENNLLKTQVASSTLVAITDIFERRLEYAFKENRDVKALAFVGGVACNKYIKSRLEKLAHTYNRNFFSPIPDYCTDNAAMIAFVGHYKAQQGLFDDFTLDIY